MGRGGFRHLADEFYAKPHPLAGWRILHPRWQAGACDSNQCRAGGLSPTSPSAFQFAFQVAACVAGVATISVVLPPGSTHDLKRSFDYGHGFSTGLHPPLVAG